eukprot:CAMPEP_0204600232 /NCGR_PEP_ID=MMETSP0661-20131031/55319_1 /ASSEMBLY_ACC=CAM_ASM_000606 /TAXON_ID=109239 /ORGANISM="Alexandrium margalefi, Strain AMGDE01CS-322" /LENGTH=36 /DNA_ID= /DNA_START= /DNA_END= /DNA_ORIENTATION=
MCCNWANAREDVMHAARHRDAGCPYGNHWQSQHGWS